MTPNTPPSFQPMEKAQPAPASPAPDSPVVFTPLVRQVTKGSATGADGFYEVTYEPITSIVMCTWGHEKCGKTDFACTAPGPIAYVNLNYGDRGVVDPYARRKKIFRYDVEKPKYEKSMDKAAAIRAYVPVWEKLKEAWYGILEAKRARTLIVDTADEAYELIRLARLGSLTKIMPEQYGPVYDEYEDFFKAPLSYRGPDGNGVNAIYIHRVDKEYVKETDPLTGRPLSGARNEWSGRYIRKGYKHMVNIAELNLEHLRTGSEGFGARIDRCRFNPSIDGTMLPADERNPVTGRFETRFCSFKTAAMMALPEVNPGIWD